MIPIFKNPMHNITSRHIPKQDLYGFKGQSVKPKQFTSSWTFFTVVKNWMLLRTILKVCFDTFPEFVLNHQTWQDWTVHLVVLELLLFLSWLFGYVEKRCDKKLWLFQNLWCHRLNNQYLQYTYYPISQKVKTITEWTWSIYKM